MEIRIFENPTKLGCAAAALAADIINAAIAERGEARIILSTGASQFDTLEALTKLPVDWSRVDMFHLDEYIDLPETHPASFRKYLRERFIEKLPIPLRSANLVSGEESDIEALSARLVSGKIDLGLIGIGENAHIAFNDPPADFGARESYIVVKLDEACRRQQLGEGWFDSLDAVPTHAVSMTPYRIMQCENIISAVPYAVKREAVRRVLTAKETTPAVPATLLREHKNFTLFLDLDSSGIGG